MSFMETTYTPAEIAQSLDVCLKTVTHWIRSGELLAVNVSRNRQSGKPRLRIRQSDLDAFMAVRTTRSPEKRQPRRQLPPIKKFF